MADSSSYPTTSSSSPPSTSPVSSLFYSFTLRPPPRSTLFPYTTLFRSRRHPGGEPRAVRAPRQDTTVHRDRKSTRLNSSHRCISYAVFCLKKKKDELDKLLRTGQPHNDFLLMQMHPYMLLLSGTQIFKM